MSHAEQRARWGLFSQNKSLNLSVWIMWIFTLALRALVVFPLLRPRSSRWNPGAFDSASRATWAYHLAYLKTRSPPRYPWTGLSGYNCWKENLQWQKNVFNPKNTKTSNRPWPMFQLPNWNSSPQNVTQQYNAARRPCCAQHMWAGLFYWSLMFYLACVSC